MPFFGISQGWFAGFSRQVFVDFGQFQGQEFFVQHLGHPIRIIKDWERFAPIALAAKDGIAQTVIHLSFSLSYFFQLGYGLFGSLLIPQSVQKPGILQYKPGFFGISFFGNIHSLEYVRNVYREMGCKIVIPLVATRNGHYRTGSISRQYIIANPNRHRFLCKRMLRIPPRKGTGDGLYIGHTVTFGTLCRGLDVGLNLCFLFRSCDFGHQFMLRCQGHK